METSKKVATESSKATDNSKSKVVVNETINKNQNNVRLSQRIFRPVGNVVSKASLFVLGIGFSYFIFYANFMNYLKKSDELMRNEINSLKKLIENNQNMNNMNNQRKE